MELTVTTIMVAFAGVFLICFMKGAFGGGFSIVGIPLLSMVMDPVTAGGLLAPLFIAMDLFALRYWKPSTWSKPDLVLLLPGLVIGIGFLLSVSLALSAAIQSLREYTAARLPMPVPLLEGIHLVTSFLVFAFLFAAIFRILPDAEIAWRDVWLGAFVTSFLFSVGKYLIGLYLGHSTLTSPFGSAGSLVLIILWVYYASLILLFGAEFTRVHSLRVSETSPPPSPGGERVKKVAIDRTTRRPKRSRHSG